MLETTKALHSFLQERGFEGFTECVKYQSDEWSTVMLDFDGDYRQPTPEEALDLGIRSYFEDLVLSLLKGRKPSDRLAELRDEVIKATQQLIREDELVYKEFLAAIG